MSHPEAWTSPALVSLLALISTPYLVADLSFTALEGLNCSLAKPLVEERLSNQTHLKMKTMPFGVPPLFLLQCSKQQKASHFRTLYTTQSATQAKCTSDIFPIVFKKKKNSVVLSLTLQWMLPPDRRGWWHLLIHKIIMRIHITPDCLKARNYQGNKMISVEVLGE